MCGPGYVDDGAGTCIDLDACAQDPCYPGVACTDEAPPLEGFQCDACPAGLAGDGQNCSEIDGCANMPCGAELTCVDHPAPDTGFECTSCAAGMHDVGNGCEEIDGCASNPCFPSVGCTDVPAPGTGYTCGNCPPGMVGNGSQCRNFNACASRPCFPSVACMDEAPPSNGFTCGPCPTEFVGNGIACQLTPPGGACVAASRIHSLDPVSLTSSAWSANGYGFVAGFAGDNPVVFGGGAQTVTLTNSGGKTYLVRINDGGGAIWGRAEESPGVLLNVGADGNLLVAGSFVGNATLGMGLTGDPPNGVTLTSEGGVDAYLAKYDSVDGHLMWARQFGGADDEGTTTNAFDPGLTSLAATSDGAVAFAGRATGDNFYNHNKVLDRVALGLTATEVFLYVVKVAANGGFGWALPIISLATGVVVAMHEVAAFSGGAVLAMGRADQGVRIGMPTGTQLNTTLSLWFAKIAADGTPRWVAGMKRVGGGNVGRFGAAAISSSNDIFIVIRPNAADVEFYNADGMLARSKSFPAGQTVGIKYDANGTFVWAKTISEGVPGNDDAVAVTATADGDVVVSGWFASTLTVDANGVRHAVLEPTRRSAYTVRIRGDGTVGWVRVDSGLAAGLAPVGVAMLGSGAVLTTGVYGAMGLECDPGLGSSRTLVAQGSNADAYMVLRQP